MEIDIFSYSDKGGRQHNEDSVGIVKKDRCTAVLCDGLGGHNSGEVASGFAAAAISEAMEKLDTVTCAKIGEEVVKVNLELIKTQAENPQWRGMRTTVAGCVTDGGKMYYFNSGDSRFYFFRNGILRTMTKDHSVSQMSVELGQMGFRDIRHDQDRSKLLKVLGDKPDSNVCTVYPPIDISRGDSFLLCSDGFWEYVTEEEMETDLSKSVCSEEWVKFMLVRLLLARNVGNDNFTVIGGMIK